MIKSRGIKSKTFTKTRGIQVPFMTKTIGIPSRPVIEGVDALADEIGVLLHFFPELFGSFN